MVSTFVIFYNYGGWGVQIFWCISGFVFFAAYADRFTMNMVPFTTFVINRFSRLYPLHAITLMLVLILQWIYKSHTDLYFVYQFNDLKHFFLQLLMASHWGLQTGDSFNGPVWSVSVEILVYALFWVTMTIGLRGWFVNVAFICLGMLGLKYGILSRIAECTAYFYAGGLAAKIVLNNRISTHKIIALTLTSAFANVIVAIAYIRSSPHFLHLLLLVNTPLLIILLSTIRFNQTLSKLIERLSNCTYSTYLLQFPIQLLFKNLIVTLHLPDIFNSVSGLLIYLSITYLTGYASFTKYERPLQDWIRNRYLSEVCSRKSIPLVTSDS